MKSERKGKIINYAISLRFKMYYLDNMDKKIKGITYAVKDNIITRVRILQICIFDIKI